MTRAGIAKECWIAVAVAAVALTACASVETTAVEDTDSASSGNVALFCRAWPDAQRSVIGMLEGEDQRFRDAQNAGIVDEAMAAHDRAAPADVRADWDRLYDVYTRASDLLTIGYAGHTIRDEHVAMMFGPGGIEKAMSEAQIAIEAIDDWAIEGCGDFCSRWPELRDAVLLEPDHWLFQGNHEDIERLLEREEAAIHAGSALVPPEIADEWAVAATLKSRFLSMGHEYGREALQGEEGFQRLMDWMGMSDDEMFEKSLSAVDSMGTWVATNCDAASLAGGAPGTVSVRIRPRDDLVGRTILLALLPVGTDFGSVTGPSEYLGAMCAEIYHPPEPFEREVAKAVNESGWSEEEILDEWLRPEPLRPMLDVGEYHEGSICSLVRYEEGDQGVLVVPGGSYELFGGTFIGDPGSYDLYFAAPQRCAQITVNVDGDTIVDLPALDACDLELIGSPEEIARRPSTAPTGESHLWIELPSGIGQEGSPSHFAAVLLPVGTTLGEIARGDTWPTGGVNFGYARFPDDEDPGMVRRAGESGLVPILPYGPGGGLVGLSTQAEWQEPWDAFFPEPVVLEAGTYDLRIHGEGGSEGCEDDSCGREFCGFAVVEVDGDTVVPLPEWGECP